MRTLFGWLRRRATPIAAAALGLFFAAFLYYPLGYVFRGAFFPQGDFSIGFFRLLLANPATRELMLNSLALAACTTVITFLFTLPLAFALARYEFPEKALYAALLLVPMVMPPFVGAIGTRLIFSRFGPVNLVLMRLGLIEDPIDWLGAGGFWAVVALEVLHLYPIMYLNIASALANVNPALEEAGRNLGARGWRLFRTVTLPLMLPGVFAGASIVFIWAFTDLGTPLMLGYHRVVAVEIFNLVNDIGGNPMGYALVVFTLVLTVGLFYASKAFFGRREVASVSRAQTGIEARIPTKALRTLIGLLCLGVTAVALLPHASVLIVSFSHKWSMSILPHEFTAKFYPMVFEHRLTMGSIQLSLFLSSLSTLADLAIGVGLAYLLVRKAVPGGALLDASAMLPLALPGLVLAFGYATSFASTPLSARENPMPLLVIAYAVRRLPYMLRAAYAGFQQTSVTLEEASLNLGASAWRTIRKISLPLILANLVAGSILAFAFAMLEVSDSLILAMREQHYPITKAIWALAQRLRDGPYIASAMGVLSMFLLGGSIAVAGRFLGKRMGELFRA